jgi:glycosidase
MTGNEAIRARLEFLYGPKQGAVSYERLTRMLDDFKARYGPHTSEDEFVTERDVILITYGDMVTQPEAASLATLNDFLTGHLQDAINTVHVLPFFPYSSDDGFSVIDYREVNPELGTWDDIQRLADRFNLMFDAVLNHISSQSAWFRGFVEGDAKYCEYFITVDPETDLSRVVRPRARPLLTPVETAWGGEQYLWTTFSDDQIDLNYANPEVLLEIIDILLFYVRQGAKLIRLDAIAYLWKEIGTSCIHLPQTHAVVQLLRAVLDAAAPGRLIITETNVPHEENVSYFGDGTNEAHMVYQFPLPPLIAHTILTGSVRRLREWATKLEVAPSQTTYFNFTASHDGVGLRPVEGILDDEEVRGLIQHTIESGGQVSYKTNPDGSKSPYELNITYYDLLNPSEDDEPQSSQVARFLVSQAIMLALAGVPGIYFHSLVGSRNYAAGVDRTGHVRTINREKLQLAELEAELNDSTSVRHAVFTGYTTLIKRRIQEPAFHPLGEQHILSLGDTVLGILRRAPEQKAAILALHNVTEAEQRIVLDLNAAGLAGILSLRDIISGLDYSVGPDGKIFIGLSPYQVLWLKS